MRKILLLLLFIASSAISFGQALCGFDQKMKELKAASPENAESIRHTEQLIQDYIATHPLQSRPGSTTAVVNIPVVVHVLHTGGAVGTIYNPSDANITGAITYLNQIYAGTFAGMEAPLAGGGVVNMELNFVLAQRTPSCGATNGIDRVDASSLTNYTANGVNNANSNGVPDVTLKDFARWDPANYYNIWVVNKIDGKDGTAGQFVAGYAYFAGAAANVDGTVMLATQMVSGQKTLPHEIGHAFNLYHTFEGSTLNTVCPVNTTCSSDGDKCCDTEPVSDNVNGSGVFDFTCRTGSNIPCGGSYSKNTEHNFMAYTTCYTLFTNDQKTRVQAALTTLASRISLANSVAGTPCSTVINFATQTDSKTENNAGTVSGCRKYTDYTYQMTIGSAPSATATATLTYSGTATKGLDYEVTTNGNFASLSNNLTFASGSTTSQSFTVRIFDDAADESAETIILNFTVNNGGGNAAVGTTFPTSTITINDNDAAPNSGTPISGAIGTATTNIGAPFFSSAFDARSQMLYTAAELQALGFTAGNITSIGFTIGSKGSTQAYSNFSIKLKNTNTAALSGTFETGAVSAYGPVAYTVPGTGAQTINLTTPFPWDGVSNLLVDICFDNATASAANDNINAAPSSGNTYIAFASTNAVAGCSIASTGSLYTGFRPVFTFAITPTATPISTALSSTTTGYLGPNDDVYFYDGSGNIMARIKNLTAFDYGCTQVMIDRSGTGSSQFWNATTANYLASKSIKVVPTNNTAAGNYQLSLYYSAAEVTGWQTATTQTWANAKMVKVSNGFYVPDVTPAAPHTSDVSVITPTPATFGSNYIITGSFSSTGFSGFGVGVPGAAAATCGATLTSAVGTNAQTLCINTAITNITYSTSSATGATFSGLPAGVTGGWAANVITITGTATAAGTFNYTATLTGGTCAGQTATGSIVVTANNTVNLTSAVGTNAQTKCINTAITNITYSTTGATGATVTGLPAGVTGGWAANVVTISGTPTAAGTFNYTVSLTGGCGTITATGSIVVTATNTVNLTSAVGTNAQTKCINTAITNITYSTTGATGATVTGLPAGVTGGWAANVVTISGTPTAAGTFNYTVTLTGGCGTITATGSIVVTATNTVNLTSAVGTNAQTKCINTAITNITYSTTGATGATVTGLPAGVTGGWAANVVTISGTPTAAGTFNYTVTLTGGCGTITATGSIVVTANNTVNLTSAVGTNAQTVCINTTITNITYSTTGATGATVTGLPAGITGGWAANVVTISGTPTAAGTFNYTVTLTGGCGTITATGSIVVTATNTVNLTSAVGTNAQTKCINTAITNITYSTTGATGATVTGLPAGVTGAWAANVVTISGTPTAAGTFNYTVTLTGGCGTVTATGSIVVTANNTVNLTSAVGTNAQTKCINTAITNITYSTTGATGATVTGLPAGVTGAWAANVVTISGTPTAAGTFNYTVTLTGGCGTVTATGSIVVTANNTVNLTSAVGTNAQTKCINTAITNITYSTTGATGATVTGLPAGVTGAWAANVVTISGTPTAAGTFNYTVTLTGGCGTITATGSIVVTANNTVNLTSAAGTNAQTKCINTAITNITYSTTGATGATVTGLPAGVTGVWAANVVTISGTPTAAGTFNYTVTLTGGCGTITANGSIVVTANNTVTLTSAAGTNAQTVTVNTPITNITYSTTGATGATVTGLPAGVTGGWAANVVTISGTPTASGTFNYTVTLTGGCGTITATGSITVNSGASVTLNLKLFLEGFYTGPSTMQATKFDLGMSADPTATDDIRVDLWSVANLPNPTPNFSVLTVLHKNGTATVSFPAAVNGNSFYIAIKHRNSIETWSKNTVAFTATTTYDFSNALSKAYDDGVNPPMRIMAAGIYALYSGDVNQDGTVDASDMANIDNDNSVFAFGYNASDVSGDGATDASDISIVDNNQQLFLFFARPF